MIDKTASVQKSIAKALKQKLLNGQY